MTSAERLEVCETRVTWPAITLGHGAAADSLARLTYRAANSVRCRII